MNSICLQLGFLGPIGVPELIMIFIVLFLVVILPLGIILLVLKLSKPKGGALPPPLYMHTGLQELEALRAQNLISPEEYEARRKAILGQG